MNSLENPLPPAQVHGNAARHSLVRDAIVHLGAAALMLLLVTTWVAQISGWAFTFALLALGPYALGAFLIFRGLHLHPHAAFGPANRVTLVRMLMLCLLAALALHHMGSGPATPPPWGAWTLVLLATGTALLDAVDGALARRTGLASAFGARFDMETDAAFILVLCALVVQYEQTGPWIFAAGLMRYAFVAAAWIWPALAGSLPPSKRRQAVCVLQIAALIACLAPVVSPALASVLGAASLALLTWSFAIDIRYLLQTPGPA